MHELDPLRRRRRGWAEEGRLDCGEELLRRHHCVCVLLLLVSETLESTSRFRLVRSERHGAPCVNEGGKYPN